MEKFKHKVASWRLDQRYIKIKGVIDDIVQHIGGDIALEGIGCNRIGHFLQRHGTHVAQEGLRQAWHAIRHVESTIGR